MCGPLAVPWCWAKAPGEIGQAKAVGNVSMLQHSGHCSMCQWACELTKKSLVHCFLKAHSTRPVSWAFLEGHSTAERVGWDIGGLWYFCLLEIWNVFYLRANVVIAGSSCTGPSRALHCPTWTACADIHQLWVLMNSKVLFSLHFSPVFYKRNVCSSRALCRLRCS